MVEPADTIWVYPKPFVGAWGWPHNEPDKSPRSPGPLFSQLSPDVAIMAYQPYQFLGAGLDTWPMGPRPVVVYMPKQSRDPDSPRRLSAIRNSIGGGVLVVVGQDEANVTGPSGTAKEPEDYYELDLKEDASEAQFLGLRPLGSIAWTQNAKDFLTRLLEADRSAGPVLDGMIINHIKDSLFFSIQGSYTRALRAMLRTIEATGHPMRTLVVTGGGIGWTPLQYWPLSWLAEIARTRTYLAQWKAVQTVQGEYPSWNLGLLYWCLQAYRDRPTRWPNDRYYGLFWEDGRKRPVASELNRQLLDSGV